LGYGFYYGPDPKFDLKLPQKLPKSNKIKHLAKKARFYTGVRPNLRLNLYPHTSKRLKLLQTGVGGIVFTMGRIQYAQNLWRGILAEQKGP